jgi:drug/metabolite transporter (DMT)-like permease
VKVTDVVPDHESTPFQPLDWALLLTTAGIWGSSFLFIAIGLDAFEPGLITFLRVGFGAITVAIFPGSRKGVDRSDWPRIVLLGAVWMAFPLTLFPIAQQWIDSSLTGMLNSAMPLMTVAVSWLVFSTPTGRRRLAGVALGFVGILVVGLPEASTAGTNAAGVVLVVVAVTSYGFAVNLAGPLQRRYGSLPVMARALVVASVLVAPFGLVEATMSTWDWGSLAAWRARGLGGSGIAVVFAGTLAGRVGPVRTSVITYIIPIVAIGLGVFFRDESVTALSLIGTGVVLAGAWLASRVD